MATALPTPPPTSAPASRNGRAKDVELVEYDRFIEKQIRKTRTTVKLVDLAYAMLQLAIGVIIVLLAATLVEQWLVTGGFSKPVRYLVFGVLVGSAGYFFVRRLWPLLWGRINPVYAAHTIEQGHPTLKNSLVNFLLFRTRREQMPVAVYDALEQQAAQGLAKVPVDLAVDRTPLIRLGYVLVAIVVVGALYAFFSPKHPFATAGRVLAPWASIAPPSRVDIDRVEPGTATVTQGETLTISAEVRGLREGETVRLRYTTADGKEVDAATTMRRSESGLRYEATLPPVTSQSLGLDDDLHYRIEAGDARTVDYRVKVLTAPAILVRQVDYEFPDYTGYVDQQVKNLGDIRGIEGTRVTIYAEANGPIQSAEVDFNADGRSDLRMKADGNKATASFVLALRKDRDTQEYTSYTLKFQNAEGRTNPRPVQYKIDVVPDYAPEVDLIAPEEKVRDVRLDETVLVSVEARDPDFGLNGVTLTGQSTGKAAFEAELLKKWPHEGPFSGDFKFTPSEHNLKPGDEVEYWATARDARQPEANVATSSKQTFRIVAPDPKQPNPNDIAQNDPQRNREQNQGEGEKQEQPGEKGEGEKQEGNQGGKQGAENVGQQSEQNEQPGEKSEQGEQNNGSAKGAQGNKEQGNESGSAESGEQSEQPQQGEQQKDGTQENGGEQQESGEQREGGQQGEAGNQSSGEGQEGGEAGEQSSGEGQQRDASNGQSGKQQGGQPGEGEQSPVANDGTDDGSAFEKINQHLNKEGQSGKQGERREGSEPSGEPNENASSEKQPGEGAGNDAQRSADQPQDNQPGTNPAGQSQPNEKEGDPTGADKGERRGEEQPQGKPGDQKPDASEGTGAKTQQGSPDSTEPQAGQEGETKSAGGEEQRPRGEAGQGGQEKPMGAPDAEQPMQERQKTQGDPNEKPPGDDQEPAMPSQSKKESDSRGEQGGDHTGGGQEGGGQKSPREGTGSEGQNTAADEGAGRSADQGPGENSNQAGSDAASQEPTGNPGEQSGEGSGEREGTGNQPGGKQGAQPPSGKPGEEQTGDQSVEGGSQAPEQNGQPGTEGQSQQPQPGESNPGKQPGQSGGATGNPTTGGTTGSEANALPSNHEAAPGDEANLEFARKQTELTLEKLSDQLRRKEVDQEMLDKLGWSEADLKRFVDRWQERIDATKRADEQGKNAKQELDQALKSLGIRPRELSAKSETQKDSMRDLRDGPRAPTPLEWQEWLRAYNQGVSRGASDRGDR